MNTYEKLKRLDLMKEILPCVSLLSALLLQVILPDSTEHPEADAPYFTYALLIGLTVWGITFVISFFNKNVRKKLVSKDILSQEQYYFLI